jgi:hypothetical protein
MEKASDDRDRVMRLILARCPELTDADLAAIEARSQPAEPDLPVEIGAQIMDVLAALEEKFDWLADAVGVNKDGGDDDAARRRAG